MSRFKRFMEGGEASAHESRTPRATEQAPRLLTLPNESVDQSTAYVIVDAEDRVWGISPGLWEWVSRRHGDWSACKGAQEGALLAHNRLPPQKRIQIPSSINDIAEAMFLTLNSLEVKSPKEQSEEVPIIPTRLASALNQRDETRYGGSETIA